MKNAGLLINLQINDVFHSYWYTAFLAVLCINLIFCSVRNFRPLIRLFRSSGSSIEDITLSQQPFYEELQFVEGIEDIGSQIKRVLVRNL